MGRVARLLQLVDRPAPIPATAKIAIHESRAHKRVPLPGPPRRGPRAATSQGCQAGRARRQQSPVGRTGLHEGYYIGSAEGHEYPNLQVGDEVDPRLSFCVNSKSINSCFF